jgi:predicted GNAT family acetyltransferase
MDIRRLTSGDKQLLISYLHEKERENIFAIESLKREAAFDECLFLAAFRDDSIAGLATYFGRHKSLVIHAEEVTLLHGLSDAFAALEKTLDAIPDWQKYAVHVIERLKHHGINPKKVSEETIYEVSEETFKPHAGSIAIVATQSDVDEIVRMGRILDGDDPSTPISEDERAVIEPANHYVVRDESGRIVSRAGIHGSTAHYAMVGGVVTLPDQRGKGYGKDTVSAVCKHWLTRGKVMILFCKNDNEPAKKIYTSLGFKPSDSFLLATY